jgi:hypothetical protein
MEVIDGKGPIQSKLSEVNAELMQISTFHFFCAVTHAWRLGMCSVQLASCENRNEHACQAMRLQHGLEFVYQPGGLRSSFKSCSQKNVGETA